MLKLILKCAPRLSYIVTVKKVRVTLVLLALTAMSLYDINISSCMRCRTTDVNWSSGLMSIGRLLEYTCTRCLDLDRLGKHRAAFLTRYIRNFTQLCHKLVWQTSTRLHTRGAITNRRNSIGTTTCNAGRH